MSELDIGQLIIYMVVLLFAISAHEAAHAWMSYKFGDDTAYLLGRVTLNPVSHTDPIGTLLIPIAGFVLGSIGGAAGAIPLIGWGKPTPVNPLRWRNKNVANVMVSIAGILANLLIAICALILIKVVQATGWFGGAELAVWVREPVWLLLMMSLIMNMSLAVFNLLPIPPLDGSKVLGTFLPASAQPMLAMLEQYGFLILMAAIYFGLFDAIFSPFASLVFYLVRL
ncbi:MAG: site-2 protease family protein, partial [Acidobacteriota bacterium]|nr:site-2 protease family protein [Acidobacteriota bacterium]